MSAMRLCATGFAWLIWAIGWLSAQLYVAALVVVLWIGTTARIGWQDGRAHGNS
jgi:hypothetical protein